MTQSSSVSRMRVASGIEGRAITVERSRGLGSSGSPVIYVHGATFPSALSVNWSFGDGRAWRDDLVAAGHDVWTFDFIGFGASDRYDAMSSPPVSGPLGRSDAATLQIAAVVGRVRVETGAARVSLVAHSWGTIAAGRFAADHPELVDHLVFFGPIVRRERKGLPDPATLPGWMPMSLEAQWKRFVEDVPADEPAVMTRAMFAPWGTAYLATDHGAAARTPPAVAIPMGPQADIAAAWQGDMGYDPTLITAAVTIVRGEWDSVSNDADAAWLRAHLTSSRSMRDVKLAHGTHLMHIETGRERLWAVTREALSACSTAISDMHAVIFEVHPTRAGYDDYLAAAKALRPLLDEIDGFLTIERFGSLSRSGWILSLSHWADEAALTDWRTREKHHVAQEKGRGGVFEDYRLRVGQVFADESFDGPTKSPSRRTTYNDHARRRVSYVGILEVGERTPQPMREQLTRQSEPQAAQAASGDSYESLTTPGKIAHLLSFDAETDALVWRDRIKIAAGDTDGGSSTIRLRLTEIERDYGMFDRAQAPQYYPEASRHG
jgi:pimeloyl-ACP methyl ester carboxylesterase/heme-degrading monooxygenase HmoA